MRLSARQDVDAPAEAVFAALADTAVWEGLARKRGIRVNRTDPGPALAPGAEWAVDLAWRGRMRHLSLRLADLDASVRIAVEATGESLDGGLAIDLQSMAPHRTRMTVRLDLRPRTLMARLAVQTLRIGRGQAEARFRDRIARIAQAIEQGLPPT